MEKRVIIALMLSFAVLFAFRALFPPPPPVPPEQGTAPAQSESAAAPTPAAVTAAAPPVAPESDIRAETAKEVVKETALYTATFSNAGGVLKSFKLKAYTDGEGKSLELINQMAAEKVGFPLALVTGDPKLDESLSRSLFVERPGASQELTFEFAAEGVHAVKTVTVDPLGYELSIQTTLTRDGRSVPHAIAWQGDFGDQSIPFNAATRNAVYQSGPGYERVNLASISDPQDITSIKAGIEDQYFLAMFLVPQSAAAVKVHKKDYAGPDGAAVPTPLLSVSAHDIPMRVYVGPKQSQWLTMADPSLAAVIDYGWFDFIAKPLVVGLLWIHSYIGNFGWAIIILTLAINLVLFPLRLKQQTSMQKMAKIQPHMKRLQDQYKKLKPTDPRRAQVQTEMMNLYKEHGVNPMGGCLPLLLQMPVLFGFYNALNYSIELRKAPWILWIKDLSQYDPYFVLPILMAVSMVLMTKLSPTTVDPAQAKMMMIMPLMLTVLFVYQSAGLVLYWLMSNVAGIGQQVFINKYWAPPADTKPQRSRTKDPEK